MTRRAAGKHAVLLGFFLAAQSFWAAGAAAATPPAELEMTAQERVWLDARPAIRVANNPNFAPIDFDDERGQPTGVAADVMALVQKKLGLRVEYVPGQTWDEAFAAVRDGSADVLLQAGRSPERESLFLFTQPYFSFRSVVVVRNDFPFVPDVSALLGRRFALVRNYNETTLMRTRYPQLEVLLVDSTEAALEAVSAGRADATIGNVAVVHYKILQLGLTNLKVATTADNEERFVQMAVRRNAQELVAILNKGLAAITPAERAAINDRWFAIEIERGLDPGRVAAWALAAIAGVLAVALATTWWLRRLRLEIGYRRESEARTARAEQRLRLVTDSIPGFMIHTRVLPDRKVEVQFVSGKMGARYGLELEYGKDFSYLINLIAPEDRESVLRVMRESVKACRPWQLAYRVRLPSGEVRWNMSEAIPQREPDGSTSVTTYVTDITERMLLEQQLAAAKEQAETTERRLREITDTIPGAVVQSRMGRDGKIRVQFTSGRLNERHHVDVDRALRDFGYLMERIVPEDRERVLQAMMESARTLSPIIIEYRVRLPDGSVRWNMTEAIPHRAADGDVVATAYVADITERKQLEHSLAVAKEQAETASRTKGEFLANMSHEIRTPLNAIMGLSYLAARGDAPPRTRDYLEKIKSSAQALLGIVNDILDVSKIEAGKLTLEHTGFSLDDVMTHLADLVGHKATEKGLELLFSTPMGLPRQLVGDPLRLGQVLVNLTSNAIKFTEKGQVVVAVRETGREGPHVRIEFSISDSGIGMTPDQQDRLFQPFTQADSSTTRKYGGTGLGLSISRSLVEKMGGGIEAQSQLGRGTTFRFSIPLEIGAQPEPVAPNPASLADLRVLVADDNAASREILTGYLQSFDLESTATATGREALEVLRQGAADGNPFRLVLLDWRLPDLRGDEVVRAIRQAGLQPAPAIVVVSTLGREEVGRQAGDLTLDGILPKPFNPSLLLETLIQALGGGAAVRTAPTPEEAPAFQPGRLEGVDVLVVEDHTTNQLVIRELLEAAGASVTIAANGREALDKFAQRPFNLILMDLQMPEMGGIEATRRLRESGCTVPIVAMTASAMPGDPQRCADAGMNDYLSKPVNMARLSAVLERLVELRPAAAAAPSGRPAVRPAAPAELRALMETLRAQLTTSDSSAVDTLDRIQRSLEATPKPRSFRELVKLVDAFSFDAALAKLEQAGADLGLETCEK